MLGVLLPPSFHHSRAVSYGPLNILEVLEKAMVPHGSLPKELESQGLPASSSLQAPLDLGCDTPMCNENPLSDEDAQAQIKQRIDDATRQVSTSRHHPFQCSPGPPAPFT